MADEPSIPADELSAPAVPTRRAEQHPLAVALANLFLPPLGHFFLGAGKRGIAIWLVRIALLAGCLLLVVAAPGRLTLALLLFGFLAALVVLPIDGVLLARRAGAGKTRSAMRWLVYAAVVVVSWIAGEVFTATMKTYVRAFRIPAVSMEPSLWIGDFIFVDMAAYRGRDPRRGDLVLFPYPAAPTKDFVKRVVGLPNEVVEIKDKQLFIDGRPLSETYAMHQDSLVRPSGFDVRDNFGPLRLGPTQLFVMGDNRDNSNDSRYWGPLDRRLLRGRAMVIYHSWDRERSSVRWGRIGERLDRAGGGSVDRLSGRSL